MLFGRYKLITLLGRGGMGEVFLARGPQLKRPVVIKRVLASMAGDADMLRAFLDETRIAARLRHPNIVRIDELGEVEGEWFVRMEYVEGASLSEVMKRASRVDEVLPLEAILSVGAGLASALDYAHHATDAEGRPLKIVHRDVTPQNVLLGRGGEVKLIDFGVARAEQRFLFTTPGLVKGKLPYMSPEQAEGKKLDARTDIFALGVCLWEALTGRRLFRGATPAETLQRLEACQVTPPSLLRPDVPPEVDALVLKALAKDVRERFQRAADLGEAIETVVEQYALPSGAKAIAALTRRLVPDAGHAPGLTPDEEATSTIGAPPFSPSGVEEKGGLETREAPSSSLAEVTREEGASRRRDKKTGISADLHDLAVLDSARTEREEDEEATVAQAPPPEEELIGRAAELADLHQLFGAGERLITLLGPGGVGKSRLAREAARQLHSQLKGKVWLADLSSVKSTEALCLAVADALGVALPALGNPVEAIAILLVARRRCLLILDNVEQLASEAAAAVSTWTEAAKDAQLLVCSRVALNLETERTYEVNPLPLERTGGDASDAERLFLERVRARNPRFPTGRWVTDLVQQLVRRLDGMPLAIELAAAQLADAPPETLKESGRARATTSGTGEFRALDEAFEASWSQLTEEERVALAQCTVFVGGFSAAAALDVLKLPGRAGETHREAVLQTLHRLRTKSLLRVSFPQRSDQARYGLYESIRGRVAGRRAEEEERARRRHASYFLHLGETHGPAAERGATALDLLTAERENLFAAEAWWLSQPGDGPVQALRVLLALDALFLVRGPYGAHLSMLDAVLERLQKPANRAPALEARARVRLSRGRLDDAVRDLQEVLASPLSADAEGRALAYLGSVRKQQGALAEAKALYERALVLLQQTRDVRMQGRVFANSGALAQEQGRLEEAKDLYAQALALHRQAKDRRFEGVTLGNLAVLQQARGEWAAAEESGTKAITVHRELGNRRSEGIAVTNLADLERDRGNTARAMAHYKRATAIHREVGNRRFDAICSLNQALLLLESGALEPAGELLDEALALFHVVGDKRHAGLSLGARAAARAKQGDGDAARLDFKAARELLGAQDLAFSAAVDVYEAQLELLERRPRDASARIELAVAPATGGSRAERFEHVRMALRVLKSFT